MPVLKVKDWPLVDKERGWDADAARSRIQKWAGGPDKENVDWNRYASCFLYVREGEEENFTGYLFPYCDIIDGEPHIVFKAAVAIVAILNGARGGANITESERKAIYEEVVKIYKKFNEEAPELKTHLDFEYRSFSCEVRSEEEEKKEKIVGYAAIFNSMSEELGGFYEIIKPGAFKDSLKNDVRALLNHDPNFVLGRTKSGTLRLKEDQKGLYVEIDVPETSWAKDLLTSIKRGDINQMSFGFRVIEDDWSEKDGKLIRTLKKVDLFDVSIVTFPAYPQTEAQVRASIKELETAIDALSKKLEELARSSRGSDSSARWRSELELYKHKLKLIKFKFGGE
jgi:hypothetical protein